MNGYMLYVCMLERIVQNSFWITKLFMAIFSVEKVKWDFHSYSWNQLCIFLALFHTFWISLTLLRNTDTSDNGVIWLSRTRYWGPKSVRIFLHYCPTASPLENAIESFEKMKWRWWWVIKLRSGWRLLDG